MGGSGPNGEGIPPHIVLTDELVERYMARAPYWNDQMREQAMSALNEVAPDIFEAGIRVGKASRDEAQEDSDTTRDVGTGSGYELDANGQVRPAAEEDGGDSPSGHDDQA